MQPVSLTSMATCVPREMQPVSLICMAILSPEKCNLYLSPVWPHVSPEKCNLYLSSVWPFCPQRNATCISHLYGHFVPREMQRVSLTCMAILSPEKCNVYLSPVWPFCPQRNATCISHLYGHFVPREMQLDVPKRRTVSTSQKPLQMSERFPRPSLREKVSAMDRVGCCMCTTTVIRRTFRLV